MHRETAAAKQLARNRSLATMLMHRLHPQRRTDPFLCKVAIVLRGRTCMSFFLEFAAAAATAAGRTQRRRRRA